jgi:hypothetical protein
VFSGALAGATSPAEHFSPLVGADLQVHARHDLTIPLEPQHALLAAAARAFRHLAPPNPVS